MTDNNLNPKHADMQQQDKPHNATIRRLRSISPFWLLPIVALLIGIALFARILDERGESITIYFTNGAGITANKTPIRYQGLQIGLVKKVRFTDDLKQIEVTANIDTEAKTILRENTKFWLVQPSASLAGVSGLDALVSGNYITLSPGDGESADEFVAESEGPMAQLDQGDILIHLLADSLGSISSGASVYYRKIPVGTIADYRFLQDKQKVEIDVVIQKPYVHLVKENSRFWNSSGIQADVSLSGINLNMDSLTSMMMGGISFDSPQDSTSVETGATFTLYADQKAAQRGIIVNVQIPNIPGLKANTTPVYYQNFKVGSLLTLDSNTSDKPSHYVAGQLLLNQNMKSLLKSSTKIVLNENSLSSDSFSSLDKLLSGPSFTLIQGEGGDEQDSFKVLTQSELLLSLPNTLVLNLKSAETYNINVGQGVYYNGIRIGEIAKRDVSVEGVEFQLAIAEEYRHLIHANSKFVAASNLDVKIGVDGIEFNAASPEKWLQGGIRIVAMPEGKGQGDPLKTYPLYKDITDANAGIDSGNLKPTITLKAQQLSGIDKGSVVLYKQFPVGHILQVRPTQSAFDVDVFINTPYRTLLTKRSKFWINSAAKVDLSPNGVSVQASPIMRTLKGAISFDNIGSATQSNTLFNNETAAQSAGNELIFHAQDAKNLSVGMPVRYKGLTIGELSALTLDSKNNRIQARALIQGQYYALISKKGSSFNVVSPEISAGAIENIDSLLQPYIDVQIGQGASTKTFALQQKQSIATKFTTGLPLILETTSAFNLSEGSPVQYRGVEVGIVKKMRLSQLGDRVLVDVIIGNQYKHLVRNNSQFWISSGYSFDVGLKGFAFETGSMQQFLKGGITFGTPSGQIVQPMAKPNQRFLLQQQLPDNAKYWNQGAAQ